MKRHEILEDLCWDGPGSPYPIEQLYDLEGLSYVELIELHRAWKRDGKVQGVSRGGVRRGLAKQLGANEQKAVLLAQKAGPALQHLARVARRLELDLDLAARVAELEQRFETLDALVREMVGRRS